MTIALNVKLINEVVVATTDKRMNLDCVHVEDDKVAGKRLYVATNGHILFCVKDEIPVDDGLPESGLDIKLTKKLNVAKWQQLVPFDFDGKRLIHDELMLIHDKDCNYPKWKEVVPKSGEPAKSFTMFDWRYLKLLETFMGGKLTMRPHTVDETSPHVYESKDRFALIMPYRID